MVKLGDLVRDKVTGFKGIAVAKTTYLNGCDRVAVQARCKDNEPPKDWVYFDEPQLEVIEERIVCTSKNVRGEPGGFKPDKAQKPSF